MYKTNNSLPEKTRTQIMSLLQERLSDSIDLMTQAKQAHWNVKGPSFIALHLLFDRIAEESETYVDLIAERLVQLGGTAEGTARLVAKRSALPEYPLQIGNEKNHVAGISKALAFYGEVVRFAVEKADEVRDAATADILTEVLRGVDKNLWFVEAHSQL